MNDPVERVKWRTKQNLDYAFLMMYAQSRGMYYVQLEDDILTTFGYITKMKKFALEKDSMRIDWFLLGRYEKKASIKYNTIKLIILILIL